MATTLIIIIANIIVAAIVARSITTFIGPRHKRTVDFVDDNPTVFLDPDGEWSVRLSDGRNLSDQSAYTFGCDNVRAAGNRARELNTY